METSLGYPLLRGPVATPSTLWRLRIIDSKGSTVPVVFTPDQAKEIAQRIVDFLTASLFLISVGVGPVRSGDLPDPSLTPGRADPALTKSVLCAPGFSTKTVRSVTSAEKRQVYARYHLEPGKGACKGGCEVDHLIPLTIGGANSVDNLWPQSYVGKWSAHVKDKLEDKLRPLVCKGKLSLEEAQKSIAKDWKAMYLVYF